MSPAAEIRVAGRGGLFVADEVRVDGSLVHAAGRWRRRQASGESWSDERRYSWSVASVLQIRWLDANEATSA